MNNIKSLKAKTILNYIGKNQINILGIIVFLLIIILSTLKATYFSGVPMDGPFQLYNSLRRISGLQNIGSNSFFIFHGVGVSIIQYPLFKILGGDFWASEFSRNFSSIMFYCIGNYLIFRAFKVSHTKSLLFTLISLGLGLRYINGQVYPEVSFKGTRAFLPVISLCGLTYFLNNFKKTSFNFLFEVIAGILSGISLFYATDQGIAVFLSIFVTLLLFTPRQNKTVGNTIMSLIIYLSASFASMFIVMFLFSGFNLNNTLNIIKYAFIDVPADQFWYFGGPPNPFFVISKIIFQRIIFVISLIVYLSAGYFSFISKRIPDFLKITDKKICFSLLLFCFYSLFSCIPLLAISIVQYTHLALRLSIIVLTVIFINIYQNNPEFIANINNFFHNKLNLNLHKFVKIGCYLFILLLILKFCKDIFLINKNNYTSYTVERVHFSKGSSDQIYRWENSISLFKKLSENEKLKQGAVWSTYASFFDYINNTYNPEFDYIIHALGKEKRQKYVEKFESLKPKYVITINPIINPDISNYTLWLYRENWDFHEKLVNNYHIIDSSYLYLIWKKSDNNRKSSINFMDTRHSDLSKKSITISIPKQNTGNKIIVLKCRYSIDNPYKYIPFIGKLPRYLIMIDDNKNAVSLNPADSEISFPVFYKGKNNIKLDIKTCPKIMNQTLKIKSVKYSLINTDKKTFKLAFKSVD